jgi:hypothetical protein
VPCSVEFQNVFEHMKLGGRECNPGLQSISGLAGYEGIHMKGIYEAKYVL